MRWLVGVAVLLGGCGTTHPLDRPVVESCETAFGSGQQGDPCTFAGECAQSRDLGALRGGALCTNGLLLIVRIEEREEPGSAPCLGERHEESDAHVTFSPSGIGCIDVTFCNEILGGMTALRIAQVCQVGPRTAPPDGEPHSDCVTAVRAGTEGDTCTGNFACFQNREIREGEVLPILGWCDGGALRFAPSQTLIHGVP